MSTTRAGITFDPRTASARALGVAAVAPGSEVPLEVALRAWAMLDDAQRRVVVAIVDLGGAADEAIVRAEALDAGDELARSAGSQTVSRAMRDIWQRGLAFRERGSRVYFMLPEVARAFAEIARGELVASLETAVSPPAPAADEHLLCCAINALRQQPIKLTRLGELHKRGLADLVDKLAPLLPAGRGIEAVRMTVMPPLEEARILRLPAGGETTVIDVPTALAWARESAPVRAERALSWRAEGPLARMALASLQDLAPAGRWPVRAHLRVLRRAMLRLDGRALRDHVAVLTHWEHDRALELLSHAGLLVRDGDVIALTADGRAHPDAVVRERPRGVHVGHDLTVLVPRGTDAEVALRLGSIARLESSDVVARYRLDRVLILEALDEGQRREDIEAWLSRIAVPALPPGVRDDLRLWTIRHGEVSAHEGMALACSDASRHEEFRAVVSRAEPGALFIASGVTVFAPARHEAVRKALESAGFVAGRRITRPAGPLDETLVAGSTSPEAIHALASDVPRPWRELPVSGTDLKPAPSPDAFVAQIKEKYRREFGSVQLAALDSIEIDELLGLEERGQVRQFLEHAQPAAAGLPPPDLARYVADEMQAVSPSRAKAVLEKVVAAGLSCQISHVERAGRTTRLLVQPLEVVTEGTGTYVRVSVGSGFERMLSVERIHALRVLPPDTVAGAAAPAARR